MTITRILLCGGGPLTAPNPDCPNAAEHTPQPEGYVAWHAWAAEMGRKHSQRKCSECGLYVIWTPWRTAVRS